MICGNGNGDEDNTKVQKGTFYVVVKELMKANNLSDITVTGHTIAVRQPSGTSGTHGFDIKEEHQWKFLLKDKEVNTNTPGNAARMLLKMEDDGCLLPAVSGFLADLQKIYEYHLEWFDIVGSRNLVSQAF